jgi:hypothetical protein
MVKYYDSDYDSDSTTASGDDSWYIDCDSTTASTTTSTYYYCSAPTRTVKKEILVEHPESWDDKANEDYVKLVNSETNTGWKVTMLIRGDVLITDPNIEVRKMCDFIPLLKHGASPEDIKRINEFCEANPL